MSPVGVFGPGENLFREGDAAASLLFLTQGHVSVLLGSRSDSVAIAQLQAGMCVGEMAMIDRGPRSATVRSEMATICLELSFAALEEPEMRDIGLKLLANLAADLAERLRKANAELRALM